MNLGVLASAITLFKYNRSFWIEEMVSIDIIHPVDRSKTTNTVRFEYNIKSFDLDHDGYVEVHIYFHPNNDSNEFNDSNEDQKGGKIMKSSQVLKHPAGALDIKGLDVGVNTIEMVLYKYNKKKKKKNKKKHKKQKKRAFKGQRTSVTWTVLDNKDAISFKDEQGNVVGSHIPGVWENSPRKNKRSHITIHSTIL